MDNTEENNGEDELAGSNDVDEWDDSSSCDEESEEIVNNLGETSTVNVYQEVLLEEEKKVENALNVERERDFNWQRLSRSLLKKANYIDNTPLFVDDAAFLLDGVSLVTVAMADNNYDTNNGGQSLHFIYLCERIIELICRKGGSCHVVFFKDKCLILEDLPEISLMISLLKIHLKKNTNIHVYEAVSICSESFINYIEEVQPLFMIIDFSLTEKFGHRLEPSQATLADALFSSHYLFTLAYGLYCLDLCYISYVDNKQNSFLSTDTLKTHKGKLEKEYLTLFSRIIKEFSNKKQCLDLLENVPCSNCSKEFIVLQVAKLLRDEQYSIEIDKNELVKIYLLYYAISECLPLKLRSFRSRDEVQSSEILQSIVDTIVRFTGVVVRNAKEIYNYDCATIGDVWQGNLFETVFLYVIATDNIKLGDLLLSRYEDILKKHTNQVTDDSLFPSIKEKQVKNLISEKALKNVFKRKEDSHKLINDVNREDNQIVPKNGSHPCFANDLVEKFCSDIVIKYHGCDLSKYVKKMLVSNSSYTEKHHWHTLRSLTDEIIRIKDTSTEKENMPIKKRMRERDKFFHYMSMYGSNIEGKVLDNTPIIVCDEKKDQVQKKKDKKQNKVSSKKEEIIKQNMLKKQKELLATEKQKFDSFLKVYKTNKTGKLGDIRNLNLVNQTLSTINSDEYAGKILYYKAEILFLLWIETYKTGQNKKEDEIDVTHLKELFLTVRKVLNYTKQVQGMLSESQLGKLRKILYSTGFSEIAEKWKLPVLKDSSKIELYGYEEKSYIRFQLKHLGPDLERKTQSEPDSRVSGFIPDPWQKKLFDIVDKRESALIVAPTSSGKTYASYYCINKVLKESNEGRVVYVAPTKALVNQVAATIYARFKGKTMPAGMALFGVFTRDYKYSSMNCQVLITVPECLDLLLLSPRCHSWTKLLRYVIFDEIHCLAGQGGGISWERCLMLIQCPFLALSATVENPRRFWEWMVNMESYKNSLNQKLGPKVHLVIHSDRHNDLVRHIYSNDEKLHHIHPFAYLKEYVLRIYNQIPPHISLSPRETLELYDTMSLASPDDPDLVDFVPDKYFSSSDTGFIYRQDVKQYESQLTKILNKWFADKKNTFHNVIKLLHQPLTSHETETKSLQFFQKEVIPFVKQLHSKNMLPALVFSYNRSYCEIMGHVVGQYYNKLEEECASQKRNVVTIRYKENDFEEAHNKGKKITKQTGFENAGKPERFKQTRELFPLEIIKCNEQFSLRGKYTIDNKNLQYIERKLSFQFNKRSLEIDQLRRGIGVHHGGVTTALRQTIEMLFRSKFLSVVFATGTLALGVHMPCKTVVILGDSPFLNTLEYHQMSGRSGRRGFDKTGDVIFFGLDSNKIRTLMTSKLPKMVGNFPLTVTTVLRVLLLVNDTTDNGKQTGDTYEATINRALTVLNQCLLYQTEEQLRNQMKHFFLFSCQLLMVQQLLDSSFKPTPIAGYVTHLHYHEPGNLAFSYLLHTGVISEICNSSAKGDVDVDACITIVILLCRLFTNYPVRNLVKEDLRNSVVLLPELPDFVNKALNEYNEQVKCVFKDYFRGFSQHLSEEMGEDIKLPISEKEFKGVCTEEELIFKDDGVTTMEKVIGGCSNYNMICSSFAGLSGQTDDNLYDQHSLISNIRHQVFTDCKIIPLVELEVQLNAYAYDFYRHGILQSIIEDNKLKVGHDYVHLLDFLLVLRSIETSLSEMYMDNTRIVSERVLNTFRYIKNTYEGFFNKAYNIRKKF